MVWLVFVAFLLLIFIPFMPQLLRLRIRFLRWLGWERLASLLENHFQTWTLVFRIIVIAVATVMLCVGLVW